VNPTGSKSSERGGTRTRTQKNMRIYLRFHVRNVESRHQFVGSAIVTAVVMKSAVLWGITICSSLKVNRHMGGTYRLHLHGGARCQNESR
jgi:hypothetical protein